MVAILFTFPASVKTFSFDEREPVDESGDDNEVLGTRPYQFQPLRLRREEDQLRLSSSSRSWRNFHKVSRVTANVTTLQSDYSFKYEV